MVRFRAFPWALVVAAPLALAACGGEDRVVVVPQSQPAPTTTIVPAPVAPATVVPPGSSVVTPSGRVVCADGRYPPC